MYVERFSGRPLVPAAAHGCWLMLLPSTRPAAPHARPHARPHTQATPAPDHAAFVFLVFSLEIFIKYRSIIEYISYVIGQTVNAD